MTGYWLLILHLFGDYAIQSDWMASEKTRGWLAAAAHAVTYTLPFALLFGLQWQPLVLIGASHFIIDHWRLARYVCWIKNFLGPRSTSRMVPDVQGSWHLSSAIDGCQVDSNGHYTCTVHPEAIARKEVTVWYHPWRECRKTGYHDSKPMWLTTWLLIITDNSMHLAINGLAWHLWGAI